MEYGAITIDTCILDNYGLRLESGLLKKLEQFSKGNYRLLISEIVQREGEDHLEKKISQSREKVRTALRVAREQLSIGAASLEDCKGKLLTSEPTSELAKRRLNEFLVNTGAEIIALEEGLNVRNIIDNHFAGTPPFSGAGDKKSEFPDAIALTNLESWAKDNETKVLAVSTDNDWRKYGAASEYIDVIDDLASAISEFQQHHAAIAFCSWLSTSLSSEKPKELIEAIESSLGDVVPGTEVYPEASSAYRYEPDIAEIFYKDFKFIAGEDESPEVRLIQVEDETIVIQLRVVIYAEAKCSFWLSVRDSIDRDYVRIGRTTAATDIALDPEILVTLTGDFEHEPQKMEIDDIEVVATPISVDFGEIEPDWGWRHDE